MNTNRRFVLDTNVLLVSISRRSQYHWIFQGLLRQKFELAVTSDILSEYEEVISEKYSVSVARNVIRALLLLPNVIRTEVYYNWNLIRDDRDDDKFVDCAVASNANAIVTQDTHFNILNSIPFPQITTLTISEFEAVLGKQREDS
jgi:putative PIN family toxin of toxin-antitoxin system